MTANPITTLVVENADILAHIAEHGAPENRSALAATFGRDRSNLHRSLRRLRAEGVLDDAGALTDRGREALRGLDLAAGRLATPATFRTLTHGQLVRDPINPRTTFDPAKLELLADTVVEAGRLLQNLVARPPAEPGGPFRIVTGERRWRAVNLAIANGWLPADFPLPVDVRPMTDAEARRAAVTENEAREDLSDLERADAYEAMATEDGLSNAEIAFAVGKTREHVQQHRKLLTLSALDQARLTAGQITFTEARQLTTKPRAPKPAPAAPEPVAHEPEPTSPPPLGGEEAGADSRLDALANDLASASTNGPPFGGGGGSATPGQPFPVTPAPDRPRAVPRDKFSDQIRQVVAEGDAVFEIEVIDRLRDAQGRPPFRPLSNTKSLAEVRDAVGGVVATCLGDRAEPRARLIADALNRLCGLTG